MYTVLLNVLQYSDRLYRKKIRLIESNAKWRYLKI
jgi:hypothetical protein